MISDTHANVRCNAFHNFACLSYDALFITLQRSFLFCPVIMPAYNAFRTKTQQYITASRQNYRHGGGINQILKKRPFINKIYYKFNYRYKVHIILKSRSVSVKPLKYLKTWLGYKISENFVGTISIHLQCYTLDTVNNIRKVLIVGET